MILNFNSNNYVNIEKQDSINEYAKLTIRKRDFKKINYENNVVYNLQNQIDKYNNIKNDIKQINANNDEKINNINEIILTLQEMLEEYKYYYDEYNIEPAILNNTETAYNVSHTLIVNYFISKNYNLSAELLTHMKSNKDYNSIYHPIMIDHIKESNVYNDIVYNENKNGSSIFKSSDNENLQDLHYAINKFNYSKSPSNKCIVITDLYDFDGTLEYLNLEKSAIDMMKKAQDYGFLTPFYTSIELENDINTNNEKYIESLYINDWKYKEVKTTVGKLEDNYYSIKFDQSGNRLIQTLGLKDTYLILFDENEKPITFDNNSGYLNNSCINYYFEKNKIYILKVSFYEDDEMGNVKIIITSNSNIKKYDDITKIQRNSNLFSYYYDDITVNCDKGNTNLYSLTPTTNDNFDLYTDKIDKYVDTYLIIVDPRICELSTQYNKNNLSDNEIRQNNALLPSILDDDSGSNLQAKILIGKHSTNTPYLIIVCNYSYYLESTFKLKINGMKSNKFNVIV